MTTSTPIVMCVAELDPTGGGGIAADIETVASLVQQDEFSPSS